MAKAERKENTVQYDVVIPGVGIPVVQDIAGVGQHLREHFQV